MNLKTGAHAAPCAVQLRAKAANDNPFTITPMSGAIPPFSKATISLRFKPEVRGSCSFGFDS